MLLIWYAVHTFGVPVRTFLMEMCLGAKAGSPEMTGLTCQASGQEAEQCRHACCEEPPGRLQEPPASSLS